MTCSVFFRLYVRNNVNAVDSDRVISSLLKLCVSLCLLIMLLYFVHNMPPVFLYCKFKYTNSIIYRYMISLLCLKFLDFFKFFSHLASFFHRHRHGSIVVSIDTVLNTAMEELCN